MKGPHNPTGSGKRVYLQLGQVGPKEDPMFKKYLGGTPPDDFAENPFKYEEKGGKYFEVFRCFDGYLSAMSTEEKSLTFEGKTRIKTRLNIIMKADIDYHIEIGDYDGKYALDLLRRLFKSPKTVENPLRLYPYKITNEENKTYSGIAVHLLNKKGNEVIDKVKALTKVEAEEMKIPEPEVTEIKGETYWDFTKQADFLLEKVKEYLMDAFGAINDDLEEPDILDDEEKSKGRDLYAPHDKGEEQSKDEDEEDDDLPF